MSFAKFQLADRRLTLLLALEAAAEYKANHFLLQRFCDSMGHSVSLDAVMADLAWLQGVALLRLEVNGDVTIATLTTQGLDCAAGRSIVPGVARPAPGQD